MRLKKFNEKFSEHLNEQGTFKNDIKNDYILAIDSVANLNINIEAKTRIISVIKKDLSEFVGGVIDMKNDTPDSLSKWQQELRDKNK